MSYLFHSGGQLLELCKSNRLSIAEAMTLREQELSALDEASLRGRMHENLAIMRAAVQKGLDEEQNSVSGLAGGDAELLQDRAEKSLMGSRMARVAAASMAVLEVNASMGKIVAAPTAGASGVLPATLIVIGGDMGWDDEKLVDGLIAAGAIGALIAAGATISGAEGGCQAETGSAAAMAAAALTELSGGTPEMALHAAAMALKNVMGLVCDPVAGLVECPCIKRNALGAVNAVLSADMALAHIKSMIPFDEVVTTMLHVGRTMSPDLRETGRGGLAASPTAKALRRKLQLSTPE